ncbi:MAG: bifunctional folylpolyglutamate synthase/dihydrofolate synthase [Clostridia bacterium]|nr:bifunctional folylpolyglutamate synthase/dihydrofolate synthase [Clostridia bacterium]
MTYEETIAYIHSVNWRGSRPGLSRITELLDKLGNPQKSLRCVHIAGTNGKGSTSAMLDSILREAGYKVGLFTSPYIESFNERIMYDGAPIADDDLCRLVSMIAPIAEAMADPPTEFELITALGFVYFKEKGCDVVVLEVGMGGRLDSTNVIEDPYLSIITGIALDHVGFLGDTVEQIAAEKAGVIKEGVPVLYGGEIPSVKEIIEQTAKEINAPFYQTDRTSLTVKKADFAGTVLDYDGMNDLFLQLLGLYQPRNLATVVTAAKLLTTRGLLISDSAIREGIAKTKWKARFEVLCEKPLFLFDGSHNMQGIDAACEAFAHYFGNEKLYLVTGVMADKAYDAMADQLVRFAKKVFAVTPDNPRALAAKDLASLYREKGVDAESFESVADAVLAALSQAEKNGYAVAALGSLYMYGEVKAALEKNYKTE